MLASTIKIFSLLIIAYVVSFLLPQNEQKTTITGNIIAATEQREEPKETPVSNEPLVLEARSACVFDVLTQKSLFELNASAQLPLASLTKLMTTVVAKENLLPTTLVEITAKAISEEGDTSLITGEVWQLNDLLDLILISSSNDAASALAETLKKGTETDNSEFIDLMNGKAKELGLNQTYFLNATGLDISKTMAGAYGSCTNISKLMNYILINHPELLEATAQQSLNINNRIFKNTDQLLYLPLFIGGKTGYSDLAGGNLTIITDRGLNHPIIMTVLGSSFEGRFKDVETLYNQFVR